MLEQRLNNLIRAEVRQLAAYHVPDSANMTKLDAMENPYTWSGSIAKQWSQTLQNAAINRYPDPESSALKSILRDVMQVPADCDMILGNGSDELIQIIMSAMAKPGHTVMSVEPTFVMYKMLATITGMAYVGVPLTASFDIDITATLDAIATHKPAIIFISYPNNPTGNMFSRTAMTQIIEAANGIVVIDEAYHSFADDSFLRDIDRYDNLLVMRTVSKMGLAGLRLGYLMGKPQWLHEFNKVRLPYNINVLTQLTAEFALQNKAVFDEQTDAIKRDRQHLYDALAKIEQLHVYSTQANFILFRVKEGSATAVFEALKQERVLIKNLSRAGSVLDNCLRVTVGKPEENALFLSALQRALR